MKTGRLLKFQRPGGEIHAYLYREGTQFRASVYRMTSTRGTSNEPLHKVEGRTEADVEAAVRSYVEERFPKA